ncbi:MAG: DNA-3-methyladenine glycosylase 2 family protein [Deltaproteobacteria bacterium]|nr:DNA-3-methyladenine glycosylase 2 family protein [Deltaproteobacteria bacterium]
MKPLEPSFCYAALLARDKRFDGRFFVGVTTTKIYCRPICPAATPKFENCLFFRFAAAAQELGLRPCLRCRPESAPFSSAWRGTSSTVSRALARIAAGNLDGKDKTVAQFAETLGVGERQLRRLFQEHVGASPLQVAKTHRILLAKQLLHETTLPVVEVALAAGFSSARRLNDAFRKSHQRAPSTWRRKTHPRRKQNEEQSHQVLNLRLRYTPPFNWERLIDYFSSRALEDVEYVADGTYYRSISIDDFDGSIAVRHSPDDHALVLDINVSTFAIVPEVITRVRRLFDVDADVNAIGEHLSNDALLEPLVKACPGLRVAGAWSGFELAMRVVLGQQISLEAGRRLTSQLVAICGRNLAVNDERPRLKRLFPTAKEVAAVDLSAMKMPNARRQTLHHVAQAALEDVTLFESLCSTEETVARLRRIRGVGEWTAQYIALRAAREPNAFPAADVGILRGATLPGEPRPTPKALLKKEASWSPWRGYAAQYLWNAPQTRRR